MQKNEDKKEKYIIKNKKKSPTFAKNMWHV